MLEGFANVKAAGGGMDSEELAIFEKILAGESKKYDIVLSNSPNIMEIGRMTYSTEEGRLRLYSLYLADLSFEWLLARKDDLKLKNKLLHIEVWNSAIRSDLEVKPHNSARLGWNAEAITIGVIKLHGIKEKQDVKFKIVKRYRVKGFHNFVTMSHADKSEGILLVPSAFNEECVDLVYVKKLEDGWTLLGLQISVAAWKTKKQQESDNSWAHLAMHSCWVPPGEKIKEVRFLYIMRKEEIQESRKMEEKSRTLRSGTVIVASEIQADWVSFAGVHSELEFLDGFLKIEEPKPLVQATFTRCEGKTRRGLQCKNLTASPKTLCRCHEKVAEKA